MAGIFYPPAPRDRLVKPSFQETARYGLDRDNPLTNRLVGCWLFNEGSGGVVSDIVSNNTSLIYGSAWNPYGLSTAPASSSVRVLDSIHINLPTLTSFSVVVVSISNAAAENGCAVAFSGADDLVIYPNDFASGLGNMRVFWRDAGGSIINVNGSDLSNIRLTQVFTATANSQKAYTNGVLVGSATSTLSGVGPFDALRFGEFADQFSQKFNGTLIAILFYSRILTQQESSDLDVNPYQIIYTPRWSHFVDLGAAPPSGFLPSWAWRKVYTIGGGTSVSS